MRHPGIQGYAMKKRIACIGWTLTGLGLLIFLAAQPAAAVTLGESTELLRGCDQYGNTNTETSFGSLAADAVQAWCGAQIALLPSGEFGANLQAGAVTQEALNHCLLRDSELAVASLTAAELYEVLETGVSHLILRADSTIDRDLSQFDGYLLHLSPDGSGSMEHGTG